MKKDMLMAQDKMIFDAENDRLNHLDVTYEKYMYFDSLKHIHNILFL